METETCRERVFGGRGWGSHECGRKVKQDGLCGIHYRAKTERERKRREFDEKWEADKKARAELKARIEKLGLSSVRIAELGAQRVSIDLDELERIVNGK